MRFESMNKSVPSYYILFPYYSTIFFVCWLMQRPYTPTCILMISMNIKLSHLGFVMESYFWQFLWYVCCAGATTSGTCILCQPGTYQTGSGWSHTLFYIFKTEWFLRASQSLQTILFCSNPLFCILLYFLFFQVHSTSLWNHPVTITRSCCSSL